MWRIISGLLIFLVIFSVPVISASTDVDLIITEAHVHDENGIFYITFNVANIGTDSVELNKDLKLAWPRINDRDMGIAYSLLYSIVDLQPGEEKTFRWFMGDEIYDYCNVTNGKNTLLLITDHLCFTEECSFFPTGRILETNEDNNKFILEFDYPFEDLGCNDSDSYLNSNVGMHFNTKGIVIDNMGMQYEDECVAVNGNNNYVKELYCNYDGTVGEETYFCSGGCSDGACITEPQNYCLAKTSGHISNLGSVINKNRVSRSECEDMLITKTDAMNELICMNSNQIENVVIEWGSLGVNAVNLQVDSFVLNCLTGEPVGPGPTSCNEPNEIWDEQLQACISHTLMINHTENCPQGCICDEEGNLITCQFPIEIKEMPILISKTISGVISITSEGVEGITSQKVRVIDSKLYMENPTGIRQIKLMPSQASSKAINASGIVEVKSIMLEEKGDIPMYYVKGTKNANLLGFIPVSLEIDTSINAETGDIVSVDGPWWSFLAF